jgi:hypothetical protein
MNLVIGQGLRGFWVGELQKRVAVAGVIFSAPTSEVHPGQRMNPFSELIRSLVLELFEELAVKFDGNLF